MDSDDDLTALLARVPEARELPRQAAHRANLVAILSAEPATAAEPQPGRPGRPALRRWLVPIASAAAVGAIAVAVTLPNLGSTARPRTGPRPAPTAHGLQPLRHGLTWQVPLTGLHAVDVQTISGTVTVSAALPQAYTVGAPSAADSVVVSATPHFTGTAPAFSSKVVGGVLQIAGRCPRNDSGCRVSFSVRLPRALPVQASTHLGTVRVTGMTGAVQVNDKLGKVQLTDVSGPVTVTDGLGDIDGSGLTSPRASLAVDLGSIDVAFWTPPDLVTASDQAGNVTVTAPGTTAYQVTATAQSGSVTVSVPRSATSAHVIRASSQLGNVTVAG
jgi:Putative adhesin